MHYTHMATHTGAPRAGFHCAVKCRDIDPGVEKPRVHSVTWTCGNEFSICICIRAEHFHLSHVFAGGCFVVTQGFVGYEYRLCRHSDRSIG